MFRIALGQIAAWTLITLGLQCNAQSAIECDDVFAAPTVDDGRYRQVDQVVLCIKKQRAVLYLRAGALNGHEYFESTDVSGQVALFVLDDQDKVIFEDRDFIHPNVHTCGGFESHFRAVPRKFDFGKIYSIKVRLIEAMNPSPQRCPRNSVYPSVQVLMRSASQALMVVVGQAVLPNLNNAFAN